MISRDISERLENAITRGGTIRTLAKGLQRPLNALFLDGPLRPLKNFANGTWLEHPLHPLLTDVPVGAWTVTLLLYIAALFFNVQGMGVTIGLAMGLGILAALATISTGLLDWMDVDPTELSVGLVHGVINIIGTVFFIIAWLMLFTSQWNATLANFIPALAGYLIIAVGAYIGGDLVFRLGTMINRNAYRSGPQDFTAVVGFSDLAENKPQRFDVKGEPVLLVRRGQRVYAVGAVCSHYGAPLEQGTLRDSMIECPWHYSRFSIEDGSVKIGPSTAPLPLYETQVKDGKIWVKVKRVAQTLTQH
ncbi:MAG TPA: Rieske 2Fe-2S domain-containing protein [Anaerolineae bacterium]|nr:Rieske 2Fe-2S domain-containing protein [Anaerolineae bacterium]